MSFYDIALLFGILFSMKLISWNVNGIRAAEKKGALAEIFKMKPDVFAVQETKCTEGQLPATKFAPEEYIAYFDSAKERKGYSGVAIYTKVVPFKVDYGLGIPEMDHEGRMLTLHFHDFVFVTCYFPNGARDKDHFNFKLRYYQCFLNKMQELREHYETVIFCGDLNVAHTEIDIERPKENENHVGFLPQERKWVDSLIENGYSDVYRETHPDERKKYTWWDVKTRSRERNVGWRIDYFFTTKNLLKKVKKAEIHDETEGSDHCPISLDIEI